MQSPKIRALWAVVLSLVLSSASAVAQDGGEEAPRELRDAYAVLLGLSPDGQAAERDGDADIYRSRIANPKAPRLVSRLEVSGNPCRARTFSVFQFPGRWARLVVTITDLSRISAAVAYASVDDLIAERNPVAIDDPDAVQIVLTGEGLQCASRLSLADEGQALRKEARTGEDNCRDRLDIPLMDEAQAERGRDALAVLARACRIGAIGG
ncbi:MAG: hypothetical protein QHC90_15965 [Shinella sp.]|nr:hypothetical protein [Shinella sp.]